MKIFVTLPTSLKRIAYLSFFGVRNLKAVEGRSISFWYQNLSCYCSILWKEVQLITHHKLTGLFLVDFFFGGGINVRKKFSLLKLLYFQLFSWNM